MQSNFSQGYARLPTYTLGARLHHRESIFCSRSSSLLIVRQSPPTEFPEPQPRPIDQKHSFSFIGSGDDERQDSGGWWIT